MITIEAGKFYRDARGQRVGPTTVNDDEFSARDWPFRCESLYVSKHGAANSGIGRRLELDLIAEWQDDAAPTLMTKALMLDAAKAAVADRGLNYGRPEDNFERIANLWNAHLANRYADRSEGGADFSGWDGRFDAADVAQMMVLMKVARLENQPAHLDSWTDIAGYAACGAEITSQTENSS